MMQVMFITNCVITFLLPEAKQYVTSLIELLTAEIKQDIFLAENYYT